MSVAREYGYKITFIAILKIIFLKEKIVFYEKDRGYSKGCAGNCYDNAQMEFFWATLKTKYFHRGMPKPHKEAHLMLFDYIETFYNTKRLHSSLGFKSPVDFEKTTKLNMLIKKESTFSMRDQIVYPARKNHFIKKWFKHKKRRF